LALFGRRPLQRVVSLVIPASKNLHNSRTAALQKQSRTECHDIDKCLTYRCGGAAQIAGALTVG
jgi:hypothetical protein